jgi:hypothetical protein
MAKSAGADSVPTIRIRGYVENNMSGRARSPELRPLQRGGLMRGCFGFLLLCFLLIQSVSDYAQEVGRRDIGVEDLTMSKCVSPGCWVLVPGSLLKVTPTIPMDLWGISGSSGTTIWQKPNPRPWVKMPGAAQEIGGGVQVYMIGVDQHVYKWNKSEWELFTPDVRAQHISVGIDDDLWITEGNTGRAMHWNGRSFEATSFFPDKISVGTKTHTYARSGGRVYWWNGTAFRPLPGSPPAQALDIQATGNTGLWIETEDGTLYYSKENAGPWTKMAGLPNGERVSSMGASVRASMYVITGTDADGSSNKLYHFNNLVPRWDGKVFDECDVVVGIIGDCAGTSNEDR